MKRKITDGERRFLTTLQSVGGWLNVAAFPLDDGRLFSAIKNAVVAGVLLGSGAIERDEGDDGATYVRITDKGREILESGHAR